LPVPTHAFTKHNLYNRDRHEERQGKITEWIEKVAV